MGGTGSATKRRDRARGLSEHRDFKRRERDALPLYESRPAGSAERKNATGVGERADRQGGGARKGCERETK